MVEIDTAANPAAVFDGVRAAHAVAGGRWLPAAAQAWRWLAAPAAMLVLARGAGSAAPAVVSGRAAANPGAVFDGIRAAHAVAGGRWLAAAARARRWLAAPAAEVLHGGAAAAAAVR